MTVEEIGDKGWDIIKIVITLNYHEVAHNEHTDMTSPDIINYPKPELRNFLHDLFNTTEDCYVEMAISVEYEEGRPRERFQPKHLFKKLIKLLFEEDGKNYEDDGSLRSFMNYLLLVLRLGKKNVGGTNAVFEKYGYELVLRLQDILTTTNGTERLRKNIALGEWIIENIEEFKDEFSKLSEPERKLSGSLKKTKEWDDEDKTDGDPGDPGDGEPSDLEKKLEKAMKSLGKKLGPKPKKEKAEETTSGSGDEKDSAEEGRDDMPKSDEDSKTGSAETPKSEEEAEWDKTKTGESEDEEEEDSEEEEESEGESEDEEEEETSEKFEDPEIDALFDGDVASAEDHEFINAKDVYSYNPIVIDKLNEQVEPYAGDIKQLVKTVTILKARKGSKMLTGYKSGKLNVKSAIRNEAKGGTDVRIFDKRHPAGKVQDVCWYGLVDLSGSMGETKSYLASQAALVCAEACDKAKVPTEVAAFTKISDSRRGGNITIIEKSFEDKLEAAKPYFGLNSRALIKYLDSEIWVPTFSGNTEEINIYYVWQKLRKRKEQIKILCVMCDGETTGSSSLLAQTIHQIEEDGIIVIGIGIECEEVADIYPNHKIFSTTDELREGLSSFLIETLSKYIVK